MKKHLRGHIQNLNLMPMAQNFSTGFFLFIACLLCFAHMAVAQITTTTRVQLNDERTRFAIGQQTYITQDPDGVLTFENILDRHKNNLRGTRQNNPTLNLGLSAPKTWMVFSVSNTTEETDWILHFGRIFDGRMAFAHKLRVWNASQKTIITDATRQQGRDGAFGESLSGAALPVEIPPQETTTFVVYLETEDNLPNTISPFLISEKNYLDMLRTSDMRANVMALFFIVALCFFITAFILHRHTSHAYFIGYYTALGMLTFAIEQTFFASFVLTGEVLLILFGATLILGLLSAKYTADLKNRIHNSSLSLTAAGAFVIGMILMALFVLRSSVFNDAMIFFAGLAALSACVWTCFTFERSQKSLYYFFTAGWAVLWIGFVITALSVGGWLGHGLAFAPNALLYALIPQGILFMYGSHKKMQIVIEEKRLEQSRENRTAHSLIRLKHSKESADQARLLRVIERERELMSELREREVLRTEEMRTAKDMADEANRAKSAFLAVVSHEIRTPMTGIMGMVRLLGDTQLNQTQNDYAQAIQKSGETMMALLNDILDFEKIESGSMELEHIDFDIIKLIEGVVTLMSGHANEKGLSLNAKISPHCPQHVVGDPTRLRQVLLNLINNAVKFTERGGVTIHIQTKPLSSEHANNARGQYHEVYFAVEDTGIGISDEAQQRLFNPFSQADSTVSRKYGGTGLGLAICKRLIEAMGDSIRVQSTLGEGSTFYFTLRMEEGRASASDTAIKPREDLPAAVPPMRILAVEDNEMNRRVLAGLLEKEGHTVILCESGEKALKRVKDKPPVDAILMDINLNGMSGIETSKAIRETLDLDILSIPIIALTGNVAQDNIDEYYAAGLNGFIAKPIDPDQLEDILRRVHTNTLENPVEVAKTGPLPDIISQNISENQGSTSYTSPKKSGYSPLEEQIKMHEQDLLEDEDSFAIAETTVQDIAPLETSMFDNLFENLGKDQFKDLITGFCDKAEELVEKIVALDGSNDSEAIRRHAHELQGMAANFGLMELSAGSKEIEDLARDKSALEDVYAHIKKLPDFHQRAQDAIKSWMADRYES